MSCRMKKYNIGFVLKDLRGSEICWQYFDKLKNLTEVGLGLGLKYETLYFEMINFIPFDPQFRPEDDNLC